ncbi:ATP-dependent DNA helicase PIF1-like [Chenopodium quinoa]|uniref:ATP-dependent DNA helicase PIF1-like n=1 Tax=Chenopodium quinoa TaxID=63459 RepID=UPI000B7842BE|nr:ATP-dependent DNA helicase PIF1-like [Chenopodium quinoa]
MGKSLSDFGIHEVFQQANLEIQRTKDIIDALDAPIPEECIDCIQRLNPAQKEAFTCIMQHVNDKQPGAFFIDGPGGTGKTFLYNALYAEIRLVNKIVLPTATSDIAAANIPFGRTTHSRFKIPLDSNASLACAVPKQGNLAALLRETTFIIWDEASMAHKENMESLDMLLQDLCENDSLFGGKVVVFVGDFRQVLPIVPRKTQQEAVKDSVVTSYLWPKLKTFKLTENIRARYDPLYSAFLLSLGNGELQQAENGYVPLSMEIVQPLAMDKDPVEEIMAATFPEFKGGGFGSDIFTKRALLTPMNDDYSVYPKEFINKLCPWGMSPHELVLKKDYPVILLRNILPSAGLWPCFSHGQLYVALSRAKKSTKIVVYTAVPPEQYTVNFTKNIVSYDVLQLAAPDNDTKGVVTTPSMKDANKDNSPPASLNQE